MPHPLEPAFKIFWHNGWMLRNAVADLKPDHETFSLEKSNSYNRIIGHIVVSRQGLCETIGIDAPDPDWGDFGAFRLAAQFDEDCECPPVQEMMAAFKEISEAMIEGLRAMSLEDLRKPSPMPVPGEDPDVMDLVAFFAMHESYHIGQLGLLARVMGRDSVMGA